MSQTHIDIKAVIKVGNTTETAASATAFSIENFTQGGAVVKMQSTTWQVVRESCSRRTFTAIVTSLLMASLVTSCAPEPETPSDPGSGATPQEAALLQASNYLDSRFTIAGYIESDFVPGAVEYNNTLMAITNMAALNRGGSQLAHRVEWLKLNMESYINPGAGDRAGALGRLITAAVALEENPRNFSGVDLVARLEAIQQPNGLYGSQPATFDGAFRQGLALAGLSLVSPRPASISPVEGQTVNDLLAVKWLNDRQCSDGSWMMTRENLEDDCVELPGAFRFKDSNGTALAVLGLKAINATPKINPLTWIDAVQGNDGGWASNPSGPTRVSDANSTGLIMAAIKALGRTVNQSQYDVLLGFQLGEVDPADQRGAFFWQLPERDPNALATLDAMTGLYSEQWPGVLR